MFIHGPRLAQLESRAEGIGDHVTGAFDSIVLTVRDWYRSFDDINITRRLWLEQVDSTLLPLVMQAYDDSASDTWEKLNSIGDEAQRTLTAALIPKLVSNAAETFLQGAKQRLVAIGEVLWNAMRLELLQGLQFGEGVGALRDRLVNAARVAAPRARNAAQTEIIGASNAGSFQQMKAAQVVALKKWVARDDDRTRQSHRDVDGTQVDMNTRFIVGGHAMDYPHDPTAPPEEVYNCRCTLVWEIVEEGKLTDELVIQSLAAAARDDKRDGAMIALVPREAEQLALADFEPANELHVTLFYLGDADDITPTQINELVTQLMQDVRSAGRSVPIFARAFGVAHWNPESDNPAWVLNVGDAARDDPSGLERLRDQVEQAVNGVGITYPAQHSPWQPHICIAYSKDDLYGELASKLGPVTFDTLRVAWGEYDIDIPLTIGGDAEVIVADADAQAFHLPTKHDQKSHGNRAGKKDNISTKSREKRQRTTVAQPMTQDEFEERVQNAANDEDVFAKLTVNDDISSIEDLIASGELTGVTVSDVRAAYRDYTSSNYEIINKSLRRTNSTDDLNEKMAKTVQTLDNVLSTARTQGDIIVRRGIKNPRTTFGDAFVDDNERDSNRGLTWIDDAFVSTTASTEIADEYGSDIVMNILIPRGMFASGVPSSEFPVEREIILPRGTRYRVVSSYRARSIGKMIFNVEVVE